MSGVGVDLGRYPLGRRGAPCARHFASKGRNMQFERRIAVRVTAEIEMMIRAGAYERGVSEAEYVRQCIHAAQSPEEIEAAFAEVEEPPANPVRRFYAPEGEG